MFNHQSSPYDFWGAPKKPNSEMNNSVQSDFSKCTCGGLGSPSCPVHGGMGQQAQQSNLGAMSNEPNYSNMTTREELDDRFRKGGFFQDEYEQEEAQKRAQQSRITTVSPGIGQEQRDLIQQKQNDYQNKFSGNEAWVGVKNMDDNDWKDWIGTTVGLGLEKATDAYTMGGYSLLSNKLGLGYDKRNQRYHQAAQEAGIGGVAKDSDRVLDTIAAFGIPSKAVGATIGKFVSPIGKPIVSDMVGSGVSKAMRNTNNGTVENNIANGAVDSNMIELLRRLGIIR